MSKSLGESSGDGFSVDCNAGFGSGDEGDERRWNGVVVEIFCGKRVGVDIHLSFPWKKVDFSGVILMAFNVQMLE